MPILDVEPSLYPEELLTVADPPEPDALWWVLHTRPRQEKSLARQLLELQIPFYLPLLSRRIRIRGRAVQSHIPLFAGYVFLLADRDRRVTALTTGRIVRSLEVADQAQLWRDLRQIQRLIASGAPIRAEDRLAAGSPVEIRSGPLAGLRGVVLRSASGNRFVVQVDFIQRGASVLLDDSFLAPIV